MTRSALSRTPETLVDFASDHLVEAVAQRWPGILGELADDPLASIPGRLGIALEVRPETRTASDCGVDGSYYPDPPRISVAASASIPRRYFTALHEVGHHLCDQSTTIFDALTKISDRRLAHATTEAICDAFAARILVPLSLRDELVPEEGPTASDVVKLYERTNASRSVCCAAAARRLGGEGYVILAGTDGVVRYAAQARPTYVIAPGAQQPPLSVLTRAGSSGSGRSRDHDRITYATGTQSPYFHADAIRHGDYVFGVYTRSRPPWPPPGGLSILPTDGPTADEVECQFCERPFQAFGRPCRDCSDHHCPNCDRCTDGVYDEAEVVVCRACNFAKQSALVDSNQVCIDCR